MSSPFAHESEFAQSRLTTHLRRYVGLLMLPLAAAACGEQATGPAGDEAASVGSESSMMEQPADVPATEDIAAIGSVAEGRAAKAGTFHVTVTNTSGALQPLTPSVVALHNPAADLFTVGEPAGAQIERIAESGNNTPLLGTLGAIKQVFDYGVAFGEVNGAPGPILPGASGSVVLEGPPGLRISLISMLVCTNDGFTGLDGLRLPQRVGQSITYQSDGYDAGTEQNTEAGTDLVPPCVMATTGMMGGTLADQPSIAEDEVIRHHPGIDGDTGGVDILDAQHQWTDPVASITIERVS